MLMEIAKSSAFWQQVRTDSLLHRFCAERQSAGGHVQNLDPGGMT